MAAWGTIVTVSLIFITIAGDFVVVTFEQMTEFDVFRKEECEMEYSYLKRGQLLDLYLKEFPNNTISTIDKFGYTYLRFHYSQVDDLVEWVYEKRKGKLKQLC